METKKKILIVDDDIDVILTVKTILKEEDYNVISASSKVEAIEKLHSERPDLAILDVMMTTHYEGFELAREILDSPELKNTPFLFQTSIDVLTTTKVSVLEMAREFRRDPNFKDLQVLLVKNVTDGTAAIDYKSENGETVFFPVKGFLHKPIKGDMLKAELKKILN